MRKFLILFLLIAVGFNYSSCDNEPIDPAIVLNPGDDTACESPTAFSASNFIEGTKVVLDWESSAETWQVQYGARGFVAGSGTGITVTANTAMITGLVSTNQYDFYVRTVCDATTFSAWVGPVSVGTAVGSCAKPLNLTAVRNTTSPTIATLSWTAAAGTPNDFQVQYGATGFAVGTGTMLTATTPTVAIPGLLTTAGYDFYVKTICSATSSSTWTGPIRIAAVTTGGTVDLTPALMTATIDGINYPRLRPFFYDVLHIDINVENDGAEPGVPRFIKLQGTDNTTEVNLDNSREIDLYIPDTFWRPGTYPLHWETGFEDALCWVRFITFTNPDTSARVVSGSLTVTEFNLSTKRIKGTFQFSYEKLDANGDVIGIFEVTNGTFNYGLDDPYFD